MFPVVLLASLLAIGCGRGVKPVDDDPVSVLIADLQSADVETRCKAAREMRSFEFGSELGSRANLVVDALIERLGDPEKSVRYQVASTLGRTGPAAERAIPALVTRLKDQHEYEDVRSMASTALNGIGAPAVGILRELLRDRDAFVRGWAACALGQMRPPALSAIPDLIERLGDEDSDVRFSSRGTLDFFGPTALPALWQALKSEKIYIRLCAAEVIIGIEATSLDAVRIAADALRHPSADVRQHAASVLERTGPPAQTAVPQLARALSDEAEEVRHWAAMALGSIGPASKEALPELMAAYQDECEEVRFFVIRALVKIGRDARPALPTLQAALRDPSEEVRRAASLGIQAIQGR